MNNGYWHDQEARARLSAGPIVWSGSAENGYLCKSRGRQAATIRPSATGWLARVAGFTWPGGADASLHPTPVAARRAVTAVIEAALAPGCATMGPRP